MAIQKWSEQIWIATLSRDPEFIEDMETLHQAAHSDQFVPDMVLDLSTVEHLNSSNLSQLLRLRKLLTEQDAQLRLIAPPDHVWALFLATGLDRIFQFSTDKMTALAELQMKT